ncbi:hypothetical protein VE00_01045 [Pseudogymnoascus sp. WSF 3629]|nr:hypothetical protein VE00_01045 [Pseudogymnoascus sp. WSF 3629]
MVSPTTTAATSAANFFRSTFTPRYPDGSQKGALASFKRRAQGAQRRLNNLGLRERAVPVQTKSADTQAPVQTEPAGTETPAPRQEGVDAESQTDIPAPPSAAADDAASQTDIPTPPPASADDDDDDVDDDDPDPFSESLEPALEISITDFAAIHNISPPPPVHELKLKATSLLVIDSDTDSDSDSDVDPNAGPRCAICREYTEIPRPDIGSAAGKIETMASLPCGHRFGHYCLLEWLDQEVGQSCPLCRSMPIHSECGHAVIPALASEAPPSRKGEGGEWEVPPNCQSCRVEGGPGMQMLRVHWKMKEARGMALVSMREVPDGWADNRIQREWVRMSEGVLRFEGVWREELERSWVLSQRGRREW